MGSRLTAKVRWAFDHPTAMYWIAPILLLVTCLIWINMIGDQPFLIRLQLVAERTLKEATPLALLAIAASLALATGGVDISTAGVATAGGVTFAICTQLGMPYLVAVAVAILLGSCSGLFVGYLVSKNLPALILSWAVGSLWLVMALIVADSKLVQSTTAGVTLGYTVPADHWLFGKAGFNHCLTTLVAIVVAIYLTNIPRRAQAVGANRDSAVYSGIRTRRVYLLCYGLGGMLSALAGVLWAELNSGARTTEFMGQELVAIAAGILGGTVMSGGYLFLPSVVAAAGFWVALRTIVDGSELGLFKNNQQYAANGLFAVVLILILLPLGKRLSGPTQTIKAEQRAGEG